MSQAVLFKQEGQHIFDYTNVYDPDVHGADPAASGKIIPAVRSMVIDNRTSSIKVYLVKAVDPKTYKVTYMDFPYEVIDRKSMILNYGNDVFMLYYDNRTTPTRLTVDAKLILFGSNVAKYKLMKGDTVISCAMQSNGSETQYVTGAMDVLEVTDKYVDGIRRCDTCYTTANLVDGDIITLELYDASGLMIADIELIARKATILNTLTSVINPIIAFDATSNQMNAGNEDYDWYILKGQSKENLSIYPTIRFSDGTSYVVPQDNVTCFIYGFEDIDTTKAGTKYPLIIKYYVNARYPVASGIGIEAGSKHVLTCEKKVKIIEKPTGTLSKVSLVPVWNNATGEYDFRFYAYNEDRTGMTDVTTRIIARNDAGKQVFADGALVSGSVVFNNFSTVQTFTVKLLADTVNGYTNEYTQTFKVLLNNPQPDENGIPTAVELWRIINPDNADEVYGNNDANYNAPMVYYDAAASIHFLSTELYRDSDEFVDTFYTKASPPALTDLGESAAPYPTHFRFRDLSTNVLLSAAIEVSSYENGFMLNNFNLDTPVRSGIVIMEFLYRVGGSEAAILFGVPVIVKQVADGTYVPAQ